MRLEEKLGNRQTQDIKNMVEGASKTIEEQNGEILQKFSGFKKQ